MGITPILVILAVVYILIVGYQNGAFKRRIGSSRRFINDNSTVSRPTTIDEKVLSNSKSVLDNKKSISKKKTQLSEKIQHEEDTQLTDTSIQVSQKKKEVETNEVEKRISKTLEVSSVIQSTIYDQSAPKYIGYNPTIISGNEESFCFPYVILPKANSAIALPQNGRVGRQGYKDADFRKHLDTVFGNIFQVDDDMLVSFTNGVVYSPDIALIDTTDGLNLFIDIEIDEPYEGTNDIANRNAIHYRGCDENRNNTFVKNGWIVIRFAEIQVHENPLACCLHIAEVINEIQPSFVVPISIKKVNKIESLTQWTKAEGKIYSENSMREKYLGIEKFGTIPETNFVYKKVSKTNVEQTGVILNTQSVAEEHMQAEKSKADSGLIPQVRQVTFAPKFNPRVAPFKHETNELRQNYENGKYGFSDISGRQVIPCIYDWTEYFKDGIARVRLNKKFGCIDKTGRQVINCIYDEFDDFTMGVASVGLKDKWGLRSSKYGVVNETGKVIFEVKYKYICISKFSEGLAKISLNTISATRIYCIYIRNANKLCFYDFINDKHEGKAFVESKGKIGAINDAGEVIIPFKFDADYRNYRYVDCKAIVKLNNKYGIIDETGKEVCNCRYELVERLITREDETLDQYRIPKTKYHFFSGLFRVKLNDKYGCINESGKEVIQCLYESIVLFSIGFEKGAKSTIQRFSDELLVGKRNGKFEIVHKSGSIVNQYDLIKEFSEGLAVVKLGEKYGYINDQAKVIIPLIYSDAESFQSFKSRAKVVKDGFHGYINKRGVLDVNSLSQGIDDLPF